MTLKGGTTPACAACKYQRRRCTPNCPLAPYFPANKAKMFQSVHRLFGVSNVTNTLKSLKTEVEKDDAMTSIIYEADVRQRYPVLGCTAIINELQMQLQYALAELRIVHSQLAAYREQGTEHVDPLAFNPELPLMNQLLMNEFGFYSEPGDNIANRPFSGLDSSLETGNSSPIQSRMDAFGIQNCEDVPVSSTDDRPKRCANQCMQ